MVDSHILVNPKLKSETCYSWHKSVLISIDSDANPSSLFFHLTVQYDMDVYLLSGRCIMPEFRLGDE